MTNILVVEDDPLISGFVELGLRARGYVTSIATDSVRAIALGLSGAFDLVLLDLRLADGDGFTVLQELRRRRSRLPVVVMTGHPHDRDVVACLDSGADDYLVKPFRFEELLARVRARLRSGADASPTVMTSGDLSVDLLTRRVRVGAREVELTAKEFALLETFMRHPDQVLSRVQLLAQVWGYDFDPATNVVSVYVAALRQKIGANRIQTVRGAGYRLSAAVRIALAELDDTLAHGT
jgi:two-component system, OmpR family, copper resistance phosphate regulon response regulator CusR